MLMNTTEELRSLVVDLDAQCRRKCHSPLCDGQKDWLFAGHPNGAHASATLFSLIETAKACGLEPYVYLRFLFEKIPRARSIENYQALLPQRLMISTPRL